MQFSPLCITSVLLTLAVVFVNGLTDAPNAIATSVTSRCMKLRTAVIISAFFNFCGVIISSIYSNAVTDTVINMVSFGTDSHKATIALAAALFAIVLWAVIAWFFGIPTSESHALIAGLTGSALSLNGNLNGINPNEWIKAIYGLFTSCIGGFVAGFIICRIVIIIFRNTNRSKANSFFTKGQIFAAICMSFMHGAQDGQKFIAILLLCLKYAEINIPHSLFPIVLICSAFMGSGTLCGGKKIIKSVGMDMVQLEKYQGFSADLAASISLFISTVFGFPVSTTHAKTTAMMGAALAKGKNGLNPQIIKELLYTWIFTFPGCALLGFIITKIFLVIF